VLAQKQQLLVRYYLWAVDGPWRLPNQLHYDLVDREMALPQFAGTKQKVLEVFARRVGVNTYSLRGQGIIFAFDENGYVKRTWSAVVRVSRMTRTTGRSGSVYTATSIPDRVIMDL
jgi:hypothetical protein